MVNNVDSGNTIKKTRRTSTHGVHDNSHEITSCKGSDGAIFDPKLTAQLLTVSAEASQCSLSPPLSLGTNLVEENKTKLTSLGTEDIPLPCMSPETASLYHILANSTDNTLNTDDESDTTVIANLRSGEAPLFLDSDDSIRDPNYCADADYNSSDDSFHESISLISGTEHLEIDQIPNGMNEIASHQPEPVNLRPQNAQQEIAQLDDEIASTLESAIVSENGNDWLRIAPASGLETEIELTGRPKKR